MNSFFNYEGPFFNVLNRLSDLVILNVLWFICCLPIVTIGASTTALYYVMKMPMLQRTFLNHSDRIFFKAQLYG